MDEAILVFDVGKSRTKLHLVNRRGEIAATRFRDNPVSEFEFGRALDAEGIAQWLKPQLHDLSRRAQISAVVPVAHGAAAALVTGDNLANPVLDYETEIPEDIASNYGALRGPFEETLSPRLPQGLNLGAQIYWQDQLYPKLTSPDTEILLWPQYWAWWLSGERASEFTSLGCHTDMWRPLSRGYSTLTLECEWNRRMPALTRAGEVIGAIRGELARETGLDPMCRILCGIHDSNAALHALRATAPDNDLSIISTGTWFIAMRAGTSAMPVLNPRFDTLANVDVEGRPVPTARFMGGRDYEFILGYELGQSGTREGVARIIEGGNHRVVRYNSASGQFVVPSTSAWSDVHFGTRADLAALHLALNSHVALTHIGATGPVIVEGRFARDEAFVSALAALRSPSYVYAVKSADGVALGAARLAWPEVVQGIGLERISPAAVELTEFANIAMGESHVEGN